MTGAIAVSALPRRFCLLASLPLDDFFKSITYRLAVVQVPVSGMWQLRASYPGGYWLCAYQASEEALRKDVYEEEVGLERATVARTIFERLVKEGRAEACRTIKQAGCPRNPVRHHHPNRSGQNHHG